MQATLSEERIGMDAKEQAVADVRSAIVKAKGMRRRIVRALDSVQVSGPHAAIGHLAQALLNLESIYKSLRSARDELNQPHP